MLKLLLLFTFIALSQAGDFAKILGNWHPIVKYPHDGSSDATVSCTKFTYKDENEVLKCTCNGVEKDFPLVRIKPDWINIERVYRSIEVQGWGDVKKSYADFGRCDCGKKDKNLNNRLVVYRLEGDYLIDYDEKDGAQIFGREFLDEETLTKLVQSLPEFKEKRVKFPCPKKYVA